MTKVGLLFSGQGAQVAQMGLDFYEKAPVFKQVINQASKICGFDLVECFQDSEKLKQTRFVQPALCAFSYGVYATLKEMYSDLEIAGGIGLSLGEYPALIASGALGFEEGMKLLQKRAAFMQDDCDQCQSAMVAILNPDLDLIEKVQAEVSTSQNPVGIANYNSPKQVVVGGTVKAVKLLSDKLTGQGRMRLVSLKVNGAFHTPLFAKSAKRLKREISKVTVKNPAFPVVSNTDQVLFTKDNIADILPRQVMNPTHFGGCVQKLSNDAAIENWIELGPGDTLLKFVKQIDRKTKRQAVDTYAKLSELSF